jgi:riboflavin kinase/FMN adenylyltransferase
VEAHLLDVAPDLYGRRLTLAFIDRIRPERRFASLDALRAQIAEDVAAARRMLGSVP